MHSNVVCVVLQGTWKYIGKDSIQGFALDLAFYAIYI